ncbi:unnamed protein product, partial [Vitis vinifera]
MLSALPVVHKRETVPRNIIIKALPPSISTPPGEDLWVEAGLKEGRPRRLERTSRRLPVSRERKWEGIGALGEGGLKERKGGGSVEREHGEGGEGGPRDHQAS